MSGAARRFEGRFDPPAIVIEKRYPHLAGPGVVEVDEAGVRIIGTGYFLSEPVPTRLKAAFAVGALALAAWLLPAAAQGLVYAGLCAVAAWAVWVAVTDRRGWPIDVRLPWRHVDQARADEDQIALYVGSAVVMGSPVPNPAVFRPEGGTSALLSAVQAGVSAHAQPETIEVL